MSILMLVDMIRSDNSSFLELNNKYVYVWHYINTYIAHTSGWLVEGTEVDGTTFPVQIACMLQHSVC